MVTGSLCPPTIHRPWLTERLAVEWALNRLFWLKNTAASKDVVNCSLLYPLKSVGALPVNSTFFSRLLGNGVSGWWFVIGFCPP